MTQPQNLVAPGDAGRCLVVGDVQFPDTVPEGAIQDLDRKSVV